MWAIWEIKCSSNTDCREVYSNWIYLLLPPQTPSRQQSHAWLPNKLLSAAEKWQRTHLNTGWAKILISCEKNVWLSSHVMQWCWWADKGFWQLDSSPPVTLLIGQRQMEKSRRRRHFSPQSGSKGICRIIVTSCWLPEQPPPPPIPRSNFSRMGPLPVQKQTIRRGIKTITSPYIIRGLVPLRLNYLSVSSVR